MGNPNYIKDEPFGISQSPSPIFNSKILKIFSENYNNLLNSLQYRMGNGLGYIENSWDDTRMANLNTYAGYDGQRKKLPEQHFQNWGYGIELGDAQTNTKLGILDVVGYLATPTKPHSSNATSNAELCYPDHLYEPIWLSDGTVNPNNYWAYYVNQTVTIYKEHIKIWETWNEPDYTTNYGEIGKWSTEPPNKSVLSHWYGTIFDYIRLLRITYEVAKKADPDCFVATGGLGYPEFLDAILRYTDNPDNGKVTNEYPAYGGAYFDCDAYHQYPKYGVTDIETKEAYDDKGSDMLAKKVVILKKNHHYTIKKHGFGTKYPEKIFINTETGYDSDNKEPTELVRRNWILKMALYQIEYDIKQIHMLILSDGGSGSGDFSNLGKFVSVEEGAKHIKSSSKARIILKKMNLGKYAFDSDKTKQFRQSLPQNMTGIVLKRKFPKVENETYYSEYMYSIWLICNKEEVKDEVNYQLNLPFNPKKLDWEGKEEILSKDSKIYVSSTPVFLIEGGKEGTPGDKEETPGDKEETPGDKEGTSGDKEGTSGFVIFLEVIGIICLIAILAIGGLYCYRKFIQKRTVPFDKNFFKSLIQ